jgi:hypothetical protein
MSHWAPPGAPLEPIPEGITIFRNNVYQVQARNVASVEPFGPTCWLSIKRVDRRPIHDWRDLQRIKNLLVGPEIEAVEIYPAESRLVDTSNQFHLWCFATYKLPFGYADRRVIEVPGHGAQQRPFPADARPTDIMDGNTAMMMAAERLVVPDEEEPC